MYYSSLFKLINNLRYSGVGTKVTRNIYKFPQTYWIISKVSLSVKNQNHGKAWGRLVWRGRPKLKDEKIGSTLKNQWVLLEKPNYQKFNATVEELEAMIETERLKFNEENPVVQSASQ